MKQIMMSVAALGLALMTAVPAQAITYTGTRVVESQTAQLSITTDNTLGVLSAANILDWTVILSFVNVPFTLFGPLSGGNSVALIEGNGLTATATDLIFNFDSNGLFLIGETPNLFGKAYCVDGAQSSPGCIGSAGSEVITRAGITLVTLDGSAVLASATPGGAVPEPATWALLVAGFGLTGAAIRRRTKAKEACAG